MYASPTTRNQSHLQVAVHNSSEQAFTTTQALHTYFRVSDIGSVKVLGLEDCAYLDNLDSRKEKAATGEAITVAAEVDRIYMNTGAGLAHTLGAGCCAKLLSSTSCFAKLQSSMQSSRNLARSCTCMHLYAPDARNTPNIPVLHIIPQQQQLANDISHVVAQSCPVLANV
jgi:hypothetical protein